MLTLTPNETETRSEAGSPVPPVEPTRLETFSKTATAARMSGTYHETAGFIKRKLGKLSADLVLEDAGRNQQLLGKVHRLVGSLRGARSVVLEKLVRARVESQAIFRDHGGRLLDGTSEFLDDLRKMFLK